MSKSYNGRLKLRQKHEGRLLADGADLQRTEGHSFWNQGSGGRPSDACCRECGEWTLGYQARELRHFCLGTGLPSVRFHALRACFATQLIRSGVPPIQIQKICGWKDLKTMQRYIRLAGIEIAGATEGLKIMPEPDVMARVVNLFTKESVGTGSGA